MMESILKTNGLYSAADAILFERYTNLREFAAGEVLLQPGEICRTICFLIEGTAYQYQPETNDHQRVLDLYIAEDWFMNFTSFTTQQPSESFIKTYTKGRVLELDIQAIHTLISRSPAFLQLGKIFERSTSRLVFFDHRFTPAQKYQWIVDHKPELIQSFPLKMIASYLKITPETLSRVRDTFSRGSSIS